MKKSSRHPEDITHYLIRAAAVFFVVSAAGATYWVVRDPGKNSSIPTVEPMTRQAMPKQ